MGETPTSSPQDATPSSQATPVPPSRTPWLLFGLLVLFALLFLISISPVLAGCGVALAFIGGIIALLPEGEPVKGKPKKKDFRWTVSGTSPVWQELTFSGSRRAFIGFWFLGHQSMEYRFDVFDEEGNEVRLLPAYPRGEPNDLCWIGDEAGPGGFVWTTDKHRWTVTVRYVLRALDGKMVRSADLHVEVKPATDDVTTPDKPTPLSGPIVRWGRLETPQDQLVSLAPGSDWAGSKARG